MKTLRTDMARESVQAGGDESGILQREMKLDGAIIHAIKVETEAAAKRLDKPVGNYLTIEPSGAESSAEQMESAAADAIRELLDAFSGEAHALVVGLGNRFVTPDSLGPRTVEKLLVTRQIKRFVPELAPKGLRPVSAICPGVLGVTGLETVEVVEGVVDAVKPDIVICIDALISLDASRIGKTLQLNDTGILPGAGVGNRQRGLDQQTLGIPVFALGVPTVVSASTIVALAIRSIETVNGMTGDQENTISHALTQMDEETRDLIVTPKDVDKLIEDASRLLAGALNRALLGQDHDAMRELLLR